MSPVLAPWAGRGSPAAARRMARGVWLNNGELIETAPGAAPWGIGRVPSDWVAYLHGQSWLDDFAALGAETSWCPGARWTHEWIAEFGRGRGPGWSLELAAQRQVKWLCHRSHLLSQASDREATRFLRALARQGRYLAWHWRWSPAGLPRLEALAGHLLSLLEGPDRGQIRFLKGAFGREAARIMGAEARFLGRNPARLLRLVDLLSAMAVSLEGIGHTLDAGHARALAYFGPRLAAICSAKGRLARFHGAPAGRAGDASRVLSRLDLSGALPDLAQGYGRIDCAEAQLIMDGAPGALFASALALEFTVGDHPILVNSGSGVGFGVEAERAARTTRSHSTMSLFGLSHDLDPAADRSGQTELRLTDESSARWLIGRSGAWQASHGVAYRRRIRLAKDGRSLQGEEVLEPETAADRGRLARKLKGDHAGPSFDLRFIIHPEVTVLRGSTPEEVGLRLPDGQRWRLRCRHGALRVEPALFYDSARLHRRATKTIVASGRFLEYLGRITWSLESVDPS